jgi:ABC-type sugar transport system substrate-binding protein
MKITKPAFMGVAALAVAVTAAACTSSSSGSGGSGASGSGASGSGGGIAVGVTVSTLNNPYFVQFKNGVQAEASKLGASVTITDANNDATQQADQVQNFVSQGDKAIIINPVDSTAAAPSVTLASRSHIPVISADRGVIGAAVTQTVASDNVTGGKLAAQQLGKLLGGKGKIVVLEGTPGTSAANDREKGFTEGLSQFPGITVVAQQTANFDRTDGLNVTANLYQAHPDINGLFAANDEMALGAVKALGAKAGHQIKVAAFDGTPDGLQAVQAGQINVDIAQQPNLLGQLAVEAAVQAAKGQQIPANNAIPVKIATAANVKQFLSAS